MWEKCGHLLTPSAVGIISRLHGTESHRQQEEIHIYEPFTTLFISKPLTAIVGTFTLTQSCQVQLSLMTRHIKHHHVTKLVLD